MYIGRLISLALWFVVAASAAYDIILSLREQALVMTPTGSLWYAVSPDSLNLIQAVVQRYLWPSLWDAGIVWLLQWPLWGVVLGLIVALWLIRIVFYVMFTRRPS